MATLRKTLLGLAAEDPRIRPKPAPGVALVELNDSGIAVNFQVWTSPADFAGVQADLFDKAKRAIDDAGFPGPERVVRMVEAEAAQAAQESPGAQRRGSGAVSHR
jgi:small conductance mechanosensitive channel